jgi:hypothetical protein
VGIGRETEEGQLHTYHGTQEWIQQERKIGRQEIEYAGKASIELVE